MYTVILNCWKRPGNLARQIEAMRTQTLPPKEIWLWVETCAENMSVNYEKLNLDRVVVNSRPIGVYGRFALAMLAPTECVAVFDDDMIPGKSYIAGCWAALNEVRGIICGGGVRFLTNGYLPCERTGWEVRSPAIEKVDVGLNCWFSRREWLSHLWRMPPFSAINGEDILLSFSALKYGSIATYTPPQQLDDSCAAMPYLGRDKFAVSFRSEHFTERSILVRDLIRSGWQTIYPSAQRAMAGSDE